MEHPTRWNDAKSSWLKLARGVSFEEILGARFIGEGPHPAKAHQKVLLYEHEGAIWVVPFVETSKERFLKTLYRSRKYTKKYRKGEL